MSMTMKNMIQKRIFPPIKMKINLGFDLSNGPMKTGNMKMLNPTNRAYIVLTLLVSFSFSSV